MFSYLKRLFGFAEQTPDVVNETAEEVHQRRDDSGYLKKFFGFNREPDPSRCGVHPQLGTSDPDKAIYYVVDEYTNSKYVELAERMSRMPFLTIIWKAPLTLQIGTSNVTVSPKWNGEGVVFHRTIVVSRPRSLADPNGFLRFEHNGAINMEEAFEDLNDTDQLDVVYALDIFTGNFKPGEQKK
jgi:hypothetical protein